MASASRIWVTGASEGIGLGLITHYRRLGWQTVGSSRRPDKPEAADQWVQADLSIAAERQRAVDQVLQDNKWPDLVVFNAGIGHWASVEDSETKDSERIFALNYWAVVDLSRLLMQKANGRPIHAVVLSSIAARFGQKNLATYSASKAALALWAESLNQEWRDGPHRIQLIMPGVVQTDIMRHSIGKDGLALGNQAKEHRGWSVERTAAKMEAAIRSRNFSHILASPSTRLALVLHDLWPSLFYLLLRRKL